MAYIPQPEIPEDINKTFPLEEEIIQQSFLGASILDFSVNLGLNSNGSNLSVRLIEDDLNYGTFLTQDRIRTAVTEGYHPWDDKAFPTPLLNEHGYGGAEGRPFGPFYGVRTDRDIDRKNGRGDTIWAPKPGAPVYFKYYDTKDLNEKKRLNDSESGSEEIPYCVENRNSKDKKDHCKIAFEFNGILTKFEQSWSTSGRTYTVNITDPREVLENTVVILKGFSGRTSPADAHNVVGIENNIGTERTLDDGWNGYYNIINVFGFYESVEFGLSGINEAGMIWHENFSNKYTKADYKPEVTDLDNKFKGAFGILPALNLILSGNSADYIKNNEPFGGPLYYGRDRRYKKQNVTGQNDDPTIYPPFGAVRGTIFGAFDPGLLSITDGVYRYKVDLSDLVALSDHTDEGFGSLPPDFRINTDKISLLSLIQQVCNVAGYHFFVSLEAPDRKNVFGDSIGESILPAANEENYAGVIKVQLIDKNQIPAVETSLFGEPLVKEGLIHRSIMLATGGKSGNDNPSGLFAAPDRDAKGKHKKIGDKEVQHSTLVSSNISYEFSDPVTGKMLIGGRRTRVVGVTPLGDRKQKGYSFYLTDAEKDNLEEFKEGYYPKKFSDRKKGSYYSDYDALPDSAKSGMEQTDPDLRDDVLHEYLPSIETDGVTLKNNLKSDWDTFTDGSSAGWNEYGREEKVSDFPAFDFRQNLPSVSNDNYLPFTLPHDYVDRNGKFDPFQFNRINSFELAERGACDGKTCDKKFPYGTCWDDENLIAREDIITSAACYDAGDYDWYGEGEIIPNEDICGYFSGQWYVPDNKEECKNNQENNFINRYDGATSGYLDLFPCWGFEQKNVSAAHSNMLDDIVDMSAQGNPIKGMWIDDDPYRDFHPYDGIFSNIEFYNPSLGECHRDDNGEEVKALKNQPAICECSIQEGLDGGINENDKGKIVNIGDCFYKREAAGLENGVTEEGLITGGYAKTHFKYYCKKNSTCSSSDKSKIEVLHEGSAGKGNNLHNTESSCKGACFRAVDLTPGVGPPIPPAIVAFYTEDVSDGSESRKKGEIAKPEDRHWQVHPPETSGSKIQLVFDEGTCDQYGELRTNMTDASGIKIHAGELYIFVPINASGDPADGDENTFESTGGLYNKHCQAVTMRVAYQDGCVAQQDIFKTDKTFGNVGQVNTEPVYKKGEGTGALTAKDCKEQYSGQAKWINRPYFPTAGQSNSTHTFPIIDHHTGKQILEEDTPKPGYVNVRHRFEYGTCYAADDPFGLGSLISPLVTDEDCYSGKIDGVIDENLASRSPTNLMSYNDSPSDLGFLMNPRTATIPLQIGKYLREAARKKEIDQGFGYHFATVTELRHAAVSFESWLVYLREMHPRLGCMLYSQEPNGANAWASVCVAAEPHLKAGVGQQSQDSYITLAQIAQTEPLSTATIYQINHAENREKATEHKGAKVANLINGELSTYGFTKMQMELIYQDVKNLAINFYGKKYLVPLPANPTTETYCTGRDPTTAVRNEESGKITAERYRFKKECEAAGYEWGPHADVSQWMNNDGVTEVNKWEIANAGWPGGDVDLRKEDKCINIATRKEVTVTIGSLATGKTVEDTCEDQKDTNGDSVNVYERDIIPISDMWPANMNFWNDEGNLKSFVIFPSNEQKRLAGVQTEIDFGGMDPEKITLPKLGQGESTKVLVSKKQTFANKDWNVYGDKVFVEVSVDPKTYWIEERSFYERIPNKHVTRVPRLEQYYLHRAGERYLPDNQTRAINDNESPDAYAKIGPSSTPGKTELNPRSLEQFSLKGRCECVDANACEIGEIKQVNEDDCTQPYAWKDTTGGETAFAKKPYALITLPASVSYKTNDGLSSSSDKSKHSFEIPLVNTENSLALTRAWFMGQSPEDIGYQQINALNHNLVDQPTVAGDLRKGSFIAAAYKPWHAGVPQESTSYRWGPWAFGLEFGKPEFDIDDSYNPASFGGETAMDMSAVANINGALKETERYYEAGSVTLTGSPKYGLGINIDKGNLTGDEGPPVTDISVNIGTNGINTTYTFSTQNKFGSLEKIYEERLRKVQRELMRSLVRAEQELIRVKRNVDQFR
tara:strand:- start:4896 stop:11114 length:6219 start_codon:yes stop_codon:yes gene_type:complete